MPAKITSCRAFWDYDNPTLFISVPTSEIASNSDAIRVKLEGKIGDETFTIANWETVSEIYLLLYPDGFFEYTIELTDGEREALWAKMIDKPYIPVTYRLAHIFNGKTYYSEASSTYSIVDALPIISASVVAENTEHLTGDSSKLIKYYSNAKASFTAEGQMGAVIDESLYIIRNGVNSAYSTECTFENVESNEFIFSAEDSRGYVGTKTLTPEMVEYIPLTNNIANNRPDALGNMTIACSGQYFNDTFGAVANTLTVQYRYTTSGNAFSDVWCDMEVTQYSDHYYASADFVIPDFDQNQYYSFETRAIDKLMTVSSSDSGIKSTPIFHWGEDDFVFEVPVEFKGGASLGDTDVDGNLNVTGDLRLKGSRNYGNTLRFGDGDYCYLKEETDDVLTIKAKQLNLETTNGVYVGATYLPEIENGSWDPNLNSNAVSSYSVLNGTYMRVGSTITIDFYIKATCKSGYHTTAVSIGGLPFSPMFANAGGGMCSGAYVSAGFDFQCFVVEKSGAITTRVQSCNHTSATNLSTSASGVFFPYGGGEITLSGTITFLE